MLGTIQSILITIHLLVVIALVGFVLVQRSEGGVLGSGGGGGFMTGRGQANFMTRTTAILAALFFATSLSLTLLANYNRAPKTIFEGTAPAKTAPVDPTNPLDALKQLEQQRQQAPQPVPVPAPEPAKP